MAIALAWGFDRALGYALPLAPYGTGGSAIVGTAPPPGSILITDVSGTNIITLQEDPDSPTIERGTQCTAQHKFTTSYDAALNLLASIGMGLVVQDSGGYIWRVVTCSIQSEEGTKCKLITVSESVSFDSPPDEFQINTVDLGIDIIKHPRYFPNLYPTAAEMGTIVGKVKEAVIRAIQAYRDSPFFPTTAQVSQFLNGQVQNNIAASIVNGKEVITLPNQNFNPLLPVVPQYATEPKSYIQDSGSYSYPPKAILPLVQINDPVIYVSVDNIALENASIALAYAAAQEIITKLWRMEDSPYMAGIEMKWSQYYFLPPYVNLGSYLEDPTYIVPDYFLKPDRPIYELPPRSNVVYPPALTDNVFQLNAAANPQDYSANGQANGNMVISWLRKADEAQWDRGLCRITYTWWGSAIGYFDPQLFGATPRPTQPSDYVTFS